MILGFVSALSLRSLDEIGENSAFRQDNLAGCFP
jgi:hypothetical protein